MKHTVYAEATRVVYYLQLKVTSPVFNDIEMMPIVFTCEGANISLPLGIDHIPEETKCLALIMDDPDVPSGTWEHWLA